MQELVAFLNKEGTNTDQKNHKNVYSIPRSGSELLLLDEPGPGHYKEDLPLSKGVPKYSMRIGRKPSKIED